MRKRAVGRPPRCIATGARHSGPGGFTLIEVLVALAILAIVAVLAYRATAAMTDSEARLAAETERWHTLDTIFMRLEGDLRAAIPRSVRIGSLRDSAWSSAPADANGNTLLMFTRAGAEFTSDPGQAGQRMGYRLQDGTLQVLYWPRLDNVASATPVVYALATGIGAFRVATLTANNALAERWPLPGDSGIPRGVRVDLTLADGTTLERWFALR